MEQLHSLSKQRVAKLDKFPLENERMNLESLKMKKKILSSENIGKYWKLFNKIICKKIGEITFSI